MIKYNQPTSNLWFKIYISSPLIFQYYLFLPNYCPYDATFYTRILFKFWSDVPSKANHWIQFISSHIPNIQIDSSWSLLTQSWFSLLFSTILSTASSQTIIPPSTCRTPSTGYLLHGYITYSRTNTHKSFGSYGSR